ncbi:hypothetical protein MP638_005831 [Amoeboaphelidium occidentale]|nr:hypothetical protein MP638_005831 [Amoeboaphelidium occidentale]
MPEKVSTRKGNNKKTSQKHKNTFSFTHNKNSKKTKLILSLPIRNLCDRCQQIVEWRKNYRKYKPLTVPKKCVKCEQKKITDAYHIICNDCAHAAGVCAKCTEVAIDYAEQEHQQQNSGSALEQKIVALEKKLKQTKMPERKRRSCLRKLGKDSVDEEVIEEIEALIERIVLEQEDDDDDFDFVDEEVIEEIEALIERIVLEQEEDDDDFDFGSEPEEEEEEEEDEDSEQDQDDQTFIKNSEDSEEEDHSD